MRWLKAAIARLLGNPTPFMEAAPVQPTPTAGPVHPEPITPVGSKPFAADTKPQSPVAAASSKKQKAASQTIQASSGSSKKQKPVQMDKLRSPRGNSMPTPVPPTPQAASQAQTKKQKAVVSTSRGKKATPNKTSALTRTARPSKARGS